MSALEMLVRSTARQMRANGVLCLTTNGSAALEAAFAELGWSDPYPIEPVESVTVSEGSPEAAVLEAPETAVIETPEGHIG